MGTSRDGESIVIDLRQITYLMKKSILWILLAALAGGIFGYAKASRDFPAYYIADVDFLVYSRQGEMLFPDKNEEEEMVVSEETPEEVLINTYTSVIISDSVLQQVIDELRLDWSLSRLRSAIAIESEKGSRIMNVAVRASRSETALDIADKLAEIYPEIVEKKVGVGAIRPIGKASLQGGAIRDNRRKYAFMGAAIFAALMFLLLVVTRLLDPTIRLDTDVTRELGVSILGAIMDEQSVRRRKSLLGGDIPDLSAAVTERLTAVTGGRKKEDNPEARNGSTQAQGNTEEKAYAENRAAEENAEPVTDSAAASAAEPVPASAEESAETGRGPAEEQPAPQFSGWRKAGRSPEADRTAPDGGGPDRARNGAAGSCRGFGQDTLRRSSRARNGTEAAGPFRGKRGGCPCGRTCRQTGSRRETGFPGGKDRRREQKTVSGGIRDRSGPGYLPGPADPFPPRPAGHRRQCGHAVRLRRRRECGGDHCQAGCFSGGPGQPGPGGRLRSACGKPDRGPGGIRQTERPFRLPDRRRSGLETVRAEAAQIRIQFSPGGHGPRGRTGQRRTAWHRFHAVDPAGTGRHL